MRMLIAIGIVCFVTTAPENHGVAQEPKKGEPLVVRVLKGWSLEKLGGDEERDANSALLRQYKRALGLEVWPDVGAVYKSLDQVATRYPDKEFLKKLDKEVDFSKNVLLRYSWDSGGNPMSYRVSGSKEKPIVIFTMNMRRTMDRFNPGSVELIIPADVYKRSAERDHSQDRPIR